MSSILPTTCSDLEVELDELAERYNFESPLSILWNADECPENLLIYLAWALSVDSWNEKWTVEVKRQVIKSSLDVHRLKGTTTGLADAVDAMGYNISLEYWHQVDNLDKGTFRAKVAASGVNIDDALYEEISRVINDNKRGTLHLAAIRIASLTKSNLFVGSGVIVRERIKIYVR